MPMISEERALKLMREGKSLMKMHEADRVRWFVVGGGQVADIVAARLVERADVQSNRDGLFAGHEQSFYMQRITK